MGRASVNPEYQLCLIRSNSALLGRKSNGLLAEPSLGNAGVACRGAPFMDQLHQSAKLVGVRVR